MTPQQQARLGEIAVWVGTAQELLLMSLTALYDDDMDGVPFAAKAAVGNALIRAKDAVSELAPLVRNEVTHE